MQLWMQARMAFDGHVAMRGKLQGHLQTALQVAFYLSLCGAAACFASAAFASCCPECINFARLLGGLLIATGICAGLMAYARNEGASTESKIIMHPWSIKELVEKTGFSNLWHCDDWVGPIANYNFPTESTRLFRVIDILLAYTYHILLLVDAAAALSGAVLLAESMACLKSNAVLYWTLSAACSVVLVGLAAFLVLIFANMPYSVLEYTKVYTDNFGGAVASAGKHIKAKIQGSHRT